MSLWSRIFPLEARKRDLEAEIQAHLGIAIDERIARGEAPQAARAAAMRDLGNLPLIEDVTRATWGFVWLEQLLQDLRYALRGMAKAPGVTAVAVLSLMLGIGASVALFSVVYGAIIAPFPYAQPKNIWLPAMLAANDPMREWGRHLYTLSEFQQLEKLPAFSAAMAVREQPDLVTGKQLAAPETQIGIRMTGGAFNFLGVAPLLGRAIQPSDIPAGGDPAPVVVLSYPYWMQVFHGDERAVGQTLFVNKVPHTIIGVMPPRFGWWTSGTFWLPMSVDPARKMPLNVFLRLRPGVSLNEAEQELSQLDQRLAAAAPGHFPSGSLHATLMDWTAMNRTIATGMQQSMELLLWAVGLLLLIACLNVANLQLARMTARTQEIAMRVAIGAGRARLIRQLLTESVMLSLMGGLSGVLLAIAATHEIAALIPAGFIPNEARITVNGYVLLFAVALSMLTGIVFGLAPALYGSRPNLIGVLKQDSGSAHNQAIRNGLVIVEIALSMVLLTGASLAVRSFVQLVAINPGFNPSHTLLAGINMPLERYKSFEQRQAFDQTLLERVKGLPGVEAEAIGTGMPYGGIDFTFAIQGQPRMQGQFISVSFVSADYLRTFGIPLKQGRSFTPQEVRNAMHLALVNEAAAKLWQPGHDAIGGQIHIDSLARTFGPQALAAPGFSPDLTVVGVVGNTRVRNPGHGATTQPVIYVPYSLITMPTIELAVRVHGDPQAILPAIQRRMLQLDPNLPLVPLPTLDQMVGLETARPRFNMALFSAFAILGLLLAAIGVYCVVSYFVTQRSREIGVRIALGALPQDILRWVMRMVATVVALGLFLGLGASFLVQRALHPALFGNNSLDLGATATAAAVLSAAALLAAWLPAHRAGKLNPVTALRRET